MRKSAYYHFKSLFENSSECVICIDDRLNVVFATHRAYPAFNADEAPALHLSSILSMRCCNRVKMASYEPVHSVCFDYIDQTTSEPFHCIVIPYLFERIYYYILHITATALNAVDKLQRSEIETIVNTSALEVANSTIPIMEAAEGMPEDNRKVIFNNILKLRKIFNNFEIVLTNHTSTTECKVIDLHQYMSDLLLRFEKRFSKFRFVLLPPQRISLTKISLEALDVMVTNLINEMLIRTSVSKDVYVLICSDSSKNYIIVSDSHVGLVNTPDELIEQSDYDKAISANNRIIAARAVVSKIARDNGGKAFFTKTFGAGVTNGIMLEKAKARISTLREEALCSTERCDRLDILLSDI